MCQHYLVEVENWLLLNKITDDQDKKWVFRAGFIELEKTLILYKCNVTITTGFCARGILEEPFETYKNRIFSLIK